MKIMASRIFGIFKFGRNGQQSTPTRPYFLEQRSSKALIIATVCLSVFVDLFLYSVPVPVLPFALRTRAGVPENETQYWISVLIPVYGASLMVTSLLCGWVSDRISSRRFPFLAGLVLLAGATLFLALGTSVGLFIAGRLLQGASAAVVWTAGLALLVDTVGGPDIGAAMDYVGLAVCFAMFLAPVLGGVVFRLAGYTAVYVMCFALFGVDGAMRVVIIEKSVKRLWFGDDSSPVDSAIASSATTPQIDFSISSPAPSTDMSFDTPLTEKSLRHRIHARLPPVLTLLGSRRLLSALWGILVQASIFTAIDTILPLHVRKTFGWSSLGAGLCFIPIIVPMFLGPIVGILSDRYGPRYLSAAGFLMCFPFVVSLGLINHDTFEQKALMCFFLFFIGFGLTLAFSPLLAEITYAVEAKRLGNASRPGVKLGKNGAYAQAYALYNIAFAAGCVDGPLWGGMIKRDFGWQASCWSLGILCGLTSIPTVLLCGGWWFDKSKRAWQPARRPVDEEMHGTVGSMELEA